MIRYGNLYSRICDKDNLRLAILNASKGKRNRHTVRRILDNIDEYVEILYQILTTKSYEPSPYKVKTINDGISKKKREISCPKFFPDQCIQWAVMLQLEPIFRKRMYYYSCASIKGGGVHKVARYVKRVVRNDKKNTKWVLQLDVKKFYPSINHQILKNKIRNIIKDKDVLVLLDKIIDSTNKGIPIGNYTSQWFANLFLTDLDNYIKETLKIKYYVRYMDDMLLFSPNKKNLRMARQFIEDYLYKNDLTLKENWQVYSINHRGIDFLGLVFYRDRTILRDSIFLRIRRRAKHIAKKGYISLNDASAMISYWGWIKISDSYTFYKEQIKPLVDIKKCKEIVSNENKKRNKANAVV